MKAATERQRETLALIAAGVAAGASPTARELAAALGVASLNTIAGLVLALETKKLIARVPRATRGLRVTATGYALLAGDAPRAPACCPTCRRPL